MFYVYKLINSLDNIPFYIGKGKNKRMYHHINLINKKYCPWWPVHHKIKSILDNGGNVLYEKIECKSEDLAFDLEIKLIKEIGRQNIGTGPLKNLTDGGEGASGFVQSEDHKQKISVALSGIPKTNEHKKALSESHKGLIPWNKGIPHSEETKIKMHRVESEEIRIKRRGKTNKSYLKKDKKLEEILGEVKAKEVKNKISNSHKGKKLSQKTKNKLKEFSGAKNSRAKNYIICNNGVVTEELTTKSELSKKYNISTHLITYSMIKENKEINGLTIKMTNNG